MTTNEVAPVPPIGIQAIDLAIDQYEDQLLHDRDELERTTRTAAALRDRIEDRGLRLVDLRQSRRILEERWQPTVAAAQEPDEPRGRLPLPMDGDGYHREEVEAAMYEAWGIIANAGGGNWQASQDDGWVAAARRWRDRYGFGTSSADATT